MSGTRVHIHGDALDKKNKNKINSSENEQDTIYHGTSDFGIMAGNHRLVTLRLDIAFDTHFTISELLGCFWTVNNHTFRFKEVDSNKT